MKQTDVTITYYDSVMERYHWGNTLQGEYCLMLSAQRYPRYNLYTKVVINYTLRDTDETE